MQAGEDLAPRHAIPVMADLGTASDWLRADLWRLQMVVDAMAFALQLPLRALDPGKLLGIRERAVHLAEGRRAPFHDAVQFDAFVEAIIKDPNEGLIELRTCSFPWRELFFDKDTRFWLSLPSYGPPLHHAFRTTQVWIWWESFLLYSLIRKTQSVHDRPLLHQIPGRLADTIAIATIRNASADIVLVSLPIFLKSRSRSLRQIVDHFVHSLATREKNVLYDHSQLLQMAQARASLRKWVVETRLSQASQALSQIASLRGTDAVPLSKSTLHGLTEFLLFFGSRSTRARTEFGATSPVPGDLNLKAHCILAEQPKRSSAGSSGDSPDVAIASTEISGDVGALTGSSIAMSPRWNVGSRPAWPGSIRFAEHASSQSKRSREIRRHLVRDWEVFCETAHLTRHCYRLERGLMMNIRLDNNADDLSALSEKQNSTSDARHLFLEQIVRLTSEELNADLGLFYRANHLSNTLEPLALYHVNAWERVSWRREIERRLKSAGNCAQERRQSIMYRALDRGLTQVCYDRLSEEATALLQPSLPIQELNSAISAPILILGRPWGVLGVFGHRRNQFRNEDVFALNEFSSTLGMRLFDYWLVGKLNRLEAIINDENSNIEYCHREICRSLSEIFMTESCILWLRDPNSHKRFTCRAWLNRPDLDNESLSPPEFEEDEERSDGGSVLGGLVKSGPNDDGVVYGRLGVDPLANAWLEKDHTRHLIALGFRSACFFVLRLRKEVVGAVSLYSRNDEPHDARWTGYVRLVAGQVAAALVGLHARDAWIREQRQAIIHELSTDVRAMADQAQALVSLVDVGSLRDDASRRMYANAANDVSAIRDKIFEFIRRLENPVSDGAATRDEDAVVAAARARIGRPSPVDLRELIKSVAPGIARQFRGKSGAFQISGPSDGPNVLVDADNLRTCFTNLCTNAMKYSQSGSPCFIRVRVENGKVHVSVVNEGPTLDAAERRRITRKGYRGRSAILKTADGLGLGLYHVEEIARLHGFFLKHVQKVTGDPTKSQHTFTLTFPHRLVWMED